MKIQYVIVRPAGDGIEYFDVNETWSELRNKSPEKLSKLSEDLRGSSIGSPGAAFYDEKTIKSALDLALRELKKRVTHVNVYALACIEV